MIILYFFASRIFCIGFGSDQTRAELRALDLLPRNRNFAGGFGSKSSARAARV